MAALLEQQKVQIEELEALCKNYIKCGSKRTAEFITRKLGKLDEIFEVIRTNNEQLINEIPDEHQYFTEQIFQSVQTKYHTMKSKIEKDLIDLTDVSQASIKGDTGAIPKRSLIQTGDIGLKSSVVQVVPATTTCVTTWSFPNANQVATSAPSLVPHTTASIMNNPTMGQPFHIPMPQSQHSLQFNNTPKLPPIQIPTFSGGSKDWRQFIDIFKAVIDANYQLGDIQKLQYLLGFLQGEAKEAVAHLQLNSLNYQTALTILEERFANHRQAANDYIDAILDAKKLEFRSAPDTIALYNTIRNCLAGLNNMGCNTSHWDPIILRIAIRKFDNETSRLFEEGIEDNTRLPTINHLCSFLLKRHQILTTLRSKPSHSSPIAKKTAHTVTATKLGCVLCKQEHKLFACNKFKELSTGQRHKFIKEHKLCSNCLSHGSNSTCKSKIRCYECKGNHHTLLHASGTVTSNIATGNKAWSTVMLATALVKVSTADGQLITLRALIDSGSQISFIAQSAAKKLKLPKRNVLASITGIGGLQAGTVRKSMKICISPIFISDFKLRAEVFILPCIDTILPQERIEKPSWLQNLQLANPNFHEPAPIQLILGADVIEQILLPQIKRGQPLISQKTKLGWIVSGKCQVDNKRQHNIVSSVSTVEFQEAMKNFFEMDAQEGDPSIINEDAEIIYQTTTTRDNEGRYIVSLPFKDQNIPPLGDSRNKALIIYKQQERRLKKEPSLGLEYNKVLQEYVDLGHMKQVPPYVGDEHNVYYLPHHAVIKAENTTTKVRVVFNASSKTTSGYSLNDHLHTGPQIQETLAKILLRWRIHRYVYTADIEKMYRMVKVHPDHHDYQRILWRPHPGSPILEYAINVVLFGQAPSAYLSIRTLHQLADDEGQKYPVAAKRLKKDFYVDNFMGGADTREDAKCLQEQLIALLKRGGFNLRKWATNDESLLSNIPIDLREVGLHNICVSSTINTLGLQWSPAEDNFRFKTINFDNTAKLTKRLLLSNIATIYDPLQWLAPMTITAKILMQKVWQSGTDWDEVPSDDIQRTWRRIEEELPIIETIRIPRWIRHISDQRIELHGFCDASEAAYAAVIYARTIDSTNIITTTLLCAKTKVTPVKAKVTLPRLELNGALLPAELMAQTSSALELIDVPIYCWSDSTIVLSWIQKEPGTLEKYVGNRVAKIRNLSNLTWHWQHIKSKENPADCASRGLSPRELKSHNLWWKGPIWLTKTATIETYLSFSGITSNSNDYFERYSNLTKLIRISAYCLRFRTKHKGPISAVEFDQTRLKILKALQQKECSTELADIRNSKPLQKKLQNLNPFIDEFGILRVGGRLRHANIDEDYKHPILLPQNHHITYLIIRDAHERTMHGTIGMVRNYIRMRYWIINDNKNIRQELHRCLTCFRYNNRPSQQLMGDCPPARVTPTYPFLHCGVDFAGPFSTRTSKGRGTTTTKGYICIFVCMVTKAIHLELVSDMTTEAFLAAFKRFTSRRGLCKEIFSDNGTNFKGANAQISKEMQEAVTRSVNKIAQISAKDGIEWKFVPVATPHFGGLWEAGVKSAKRHIKCVFDEAKIVPTFEEFATVLCQIEACLNSRPLVALSSNPEDLEALTPAHFLTSRTPLSLPEIDRTDEVLYNRWEQLKQLHQIFWKRWTSEYLHHLQARSKWTQGTPNIRPGTLVLIRERDTPPTKWPLARIRDVHPGDDGKVRAVTIQYHGNKTKQIGIVNLCKLPIDLPPEPERPPPSNDNKVSRKRPAILNKQPATQSKPATSERKQIYRAEKKPKVAPCLWARSLLNITIVILLFGVVFGQNTSSRHFQVWKPQGGYYIEKLGHSKIIRGNLRLEAEVPIAEMFVDQQNIDLTLNNTREMCQRTQNLVQTTHCDALLHHLSTKHDHIAAQIKEALNIPVRRQARGLLGKMMTAVFGVNDEIYSDIDTMHQNQQGLLQLMTQQNIQVSTRIEAMKTKIATKFNEFSQKINNVIQTVNSMSRWFARVDHVKISVEVIATYLTAVDYYSELEAKYNKFASVLHDNGNILNFIKWDVIAETTRAVALKLGPQYAISTVPQPRTTIFRDNTTIILCGYFYIKESSEYELIHVTAIPHKVQPTKFLVPQVTTPLLAVNFNQETYFELDDDEFDKCTVEDDTMLCTPKLTRNINLYPNCLLDAVYERPNRPDCPAYSITTTKTSWKQLAARNSWMFVTITPVTASITCNGERSEISLNDVGIIHTTNGCIISAEGITLRPATTEARRVTATNIKAMIPRFDNATKTSKVPEINLIPPFKQIFERDLETIPPPSLTINELHHHHLVWKGSTIGLFSLIFCGVIVMLIQKKVHRKWCHKAKGVQDQNELNRSEEISLAARLEQIIAAPPAC